MARNCRKKLALTADEHQLALEESHLLRCSSKGTRDPLALQTEVTKKARQGAQDQKRLLPTAQQRHVQELKQCHDSDKETGAWHSQTQLDARVQEARQEERLLAEARQQDMEQRVAELQVQLQEAECRAQQAAHFQDMLPIADGARSESGVQSKYKEAVASDVEAELCRLAAADSTVRDVVSDVEAELRMLSAVDATVREDLSAVVYELSCCERERDSLREELSGIQRSLPALLITHNTFTQTSPRMSVNDASMQTSRRSSENDASTQTFPRSSGHELEAGRGHDIACDSDNETVLEQNLCHQTDTQSCMQERLSFLEVKCDRLSTRLRQERKVTAKLRELVKSRPKIDEDVTDVTDYPDDQDERGSDLERVAVTNAISQRFVRDPANIRALRQVSENAANAARAVTDAWRELDLGLGRPARDASRQKTSGKRPRSARPGLIHRSDRL